jgi:hypothetical protein
MAIAVSGLDKTTIDMGSIIFDKAYGADHAGCVPEELSCSP